MKICTECQRPDPPCGFGVRRAAWDLKTSKCKDCLAAIDRLKYKSIKIKRHEASANIKGVRDRERESAIIIAGSAYSEYLHKNTDASYEKWKTLNSHCLSIGVNKKTLKSRMFKIKSTPPTLTMTYGQRTIFKGATVGFESSKTKRFSLIRFI